MIKLKYEMNVIKKEYLNFPWRLRLLEDCPDFLFVLGNINILNNFSIAVVGSRDCDEYGRKITESISKELALRGICVVSGLAEGIDTFAHKGALKAAGKTIAIIGNGFENIYPPCNKTFVDEIIKNGGAIISEYLPDQKPLKLCFPKRNRLVACMTDGTLVTQAREDSGALITAKIAKYYGKKVFACPNQLYNDKAVGSNLLLKNGAKCVLNVADVLNEYQYYHYIANNITCNILPPQEYLETYSIVDSQPKHLDEICKLSNKSTQNVIADLTMLEMNGFVVQLPGGYYCTK